MGIIYILGSLGSGRSQVDDPRAVRSAASAASARWPRWQSLAQRRVLRTTFGLGRSPELQQSFFKQLASGMYSILYGLLEALRDMGLPAVRGIFWGGLYRGAQD